MGKVMVQIAQKLHSARARLGQSDSMQRTVMMQMPRLTLTVKADGASLWELIHYVSLSMYSQKSFRESSPTVLEDWPQSSEMGGLPAMQMQVRSIHPADVIEKGDVITKERPKHRPRQCVSLSTP
jgi:hypothetical protein